MKKAIDNTLKKWLLCALPLLVALQSYAQSSLKLEGTAVTNTLQTAVATTGTGLPLSISSPVQSVAMSGTVS